MKGADLCRDKNATIWDWIRLFEPENKIALEVAGQWAYIAERSFRSGRYNKNDDAEAFYEQFGRKPKSRFASRETSHYLAAIEALADYEQAPEKLSFFAKWLISNKNESGSWDLGAGAKDGVYFPLSDSWRRKEFRISDCTERINNLLQKIT